MEESTGGRIVGPKFLAVFSLSVILLGVGAFVIHNRPFKIDGDDSDAAIADSEGALEQNGAILMADPNPVPRAPERVKTTISWNTPDNTFTQIFVRVQEENYQEKLFAQGRRGSKEVDWIASNKHYEFRMYAGSEKKHLLAVLKIPKN